MQSFVLERPLYQQTLWFIRRYPGLVERYNDMIKIGGMGESIPKGGMPSSPVENAAMRRVAISVQIAAVDRALAMIPEAYRDGIMKNITLRIPYPHYAAINTWKMWKQRFVFYTAREIGWMQ